MAATRRQWFVPFLIALGVVLSIVWLFQFADSSQDDNRLETPGSGAVILSGATGHLPEDSSRPLTPESTEGLKNKEVAPDLTETALTVTVRAEDGRPIEGAFVEIVRSKSRHDLRNPFDYGSTNDLGQFIARVPIRKVLVLVNRSRSSKRFFREDVTRVSLERLAEQKVDVELEEAAGRLIVRAVTEDGTPVRNATFSVRDADSSMRFSSWTNSKGEVTFDRLSTGTAMLYAEFRGESPKVIKPEKQAVVIEPGRVAAVNLVLVRYGGVTITSVIEGRKPESQFDLQVNFSSASESLIGSFYTCHLIAGEEKTLPLPPGRYTVDATCKNKGGPALVRLDSREVTITTAAETSCVATIFNKGHRLTGRVLDREGEGIERVTVSGILREENRMNERTALSTMTDADGRFVFPALPQGTMELDLRSNHYPSPFARYPAQRRIRTTVKTDAGEVLLTLEPGYAVTVGLPTNRAQGTTLELDGHPYGRLRVGQLLETFTFQNMFQGKYDLTLRTKKGAILSHTTVDFGSLESGVFQLKVDL